MPGFVANDDRLVSLVDAEALIKEIDRLKAETARLKATVAELDHLAHHDALVNLPNRRNFSLRLQEVIARVERYGDCAAVLFVDVDGLKTINDRLGHEAGDAALIQVAQVLAASSRACDCVARLGGDEFALLLERVDELGAWHIGLRIVETIVGLNFSINGHRLRLSVAVGAAAIEPGDDPRSVLDRADKAMYRVKAA